MSARSGDEARSQLRVLILGDSISIGYTPYVQEGLIGEASVFRPTLEGGARPENCAGTSRGVKEVQGWLQIDGGSFDVIHFNFGLHDLKRVNAETGRGSNSSSDPHQADLNLYMAQLGEIAGALQDSGAHLIFGTTTPVPPGGVKPHREPADVELYNRAAVELMSEMGIDVNDLYAVALPRLSELQRPVNVHFTPEGSAALADAVVLAIQASQASR